MADYHYSQYDSETIKDIQQRTGALDDSIWGPSTVKAIAEWYAKHGDLSWEEFNQAWSDSGEESLYDVRRIVKEEDRAVVLDTSSHQGVVDAGQVIGTGVAGVVMRISLGSKTQDERWETYWDDFEGLPRGCYHLAYLVWEGEKTDPVASAMNYVNTLGDRVPELGDWLDLETRLVEELVVKEGAEAAAQWIDTWIDTVRGVTGRAAGLYWSSRLFNPNEEASLGVFTEMFRHLKTWWPIYPASPPEDPLPLTVMPPRHPEGWCWCLWQFTDSGECPGIVTNTVDVNVFNGSLVAFKRTFGLS